MSETLGRIGYAGLGKIGAPGARHLSEAGADLFVWNRSDAAAERAVTHGATRAPTLPELARHVGDGIICLSLTNAEVVEKIVFGAGGLHEALHDGAIIIDFGTTGVAATRRFARRANWVDAPVSGGQVGAEAGNLTIMVGGSDEHVARAMPVLRAVGENITHLGPSTSGQVTKLANQLIVAQTIDAVAQALRISELAGLDPAEVRNALLGGFAESRVLDLLGGRMIRRDFEPGGTSNFQLKDVRLLCELADSVGFASPALDVCRAQWERFVEEQGNGGLDHSALFMLYE